MNKETLGSTIILAFVVLVLVLIMSGLDSRDQSKIQEWAKDNGYTIINSERCYFESGPYWVTEDTRIYKVSLEKQKTHWFRFGFFGTDIEEY